MKSKKGDDGQSNSGSCHQPRYAFIDNSPKPFFNGSNLKGFIPAIASDLMSLTPDKLIGALLGSLCLFAFPHSPILWFAVGLLWILDVGNNMAMEPYRAFVGDYRGTLSYNSVKTDL